MTDTPAEVAEARLLIANLQSMRDRLAPFLAEHFGEAFDGDMDTLQEAIAHVKRAGDDIALLRGQKRGWQARCDSWQEHAESLESQLAAQRERDGRDAERWRALLAGRVRVIGSAGLHSEVNPYGEPHNGYAHIGLELWTKHEAPSYPHAVDDLTKYADIAVAALKDRPCPP